jgi:hypothetical protein
MPPDEQQSMTDNTSTERRELKIRVKQNDYDANITPGLIVAVNEIL